MGDRSLYTMYKTLLSVTLSWAKPFTNLVRTTFLLPQTTNMPKFDRQTKKDSLIVSSFCPDLEIPSVSLRTFCQCLLFPTKQNQVKSNASKNFATKKFTVSRITCWKKNIYIYSLQIDGNSRFVRKNPTNQSFSYRYWKKILYHDINLNVETSRTKLVFVKKKTEKCVLNSKYDGSRKKWTLKIDVPNRFAFGNVHVFRLILTRQILRVQRRIFFYIATRGISQFHSLPPQGPYLINPRKTWRIHWPPAINRLLWAFNKIKHEKKLHRAVWWKNASQITHHKQTRIKKKWSYIFRDSLYYDTPG